MNLPKICRHVALKISRLKPRTVDDTTECEFARAVKEEEEEKKNQAFRVIFTTYLPHNFHKSKIGT